MEPDISQQPSGSQLTQNITEPQTTSTDRDESSDEGTSLAPYNPSLDPHRYFQVCFF